jgi:hypothetical protein
VTYCSVTWLAESDGYTLSVLKEEIRLVETVNKKTALDPELVRDFVANAHGNLAHVQELLQQEPTLVNAAWDWGGGDWETGLGAASHVGRKDIALFLLDHGARLDMFAAAMLGRVEIVAAILAAFPAARTLRGPHGIPLLDHARVGGDEAAGVVALLARVQEPV